MQVDDIISIEEKIYNSYIVMRKDILKNDGYKYKNLDEYINSKDFKYGFFAGVKVILSIFLDRDN